MLNLDKNIFSPVHLQVTKDVAIMPQYSTKRMQIEKLDVIKIIIIIIIIKVAQIYYHNIPAIQQFCNNERGNKCHYIKRRNALINDSDGSWVNKELLHL